MSYENVLVEIVAENVGEITLNRPKSLNTFSLPLARELLTGNGSAFVWISDENVHIVMCFGGSWPGFLGRSRGLRQGSLSPCYWQMIK